MTAPAPAPLLVAADVEAHQQFVDLVAEVRPELFRYCARMAGSVFDGEDLVQETLAKAHAALAGMTPALAGMTPALAGMTPALAGMTPALAGMTEPPPLKPWLFRIAHNAAMDFLKRYERRHVDLVAEPPEVSDAMDDDVDPALVEAALLRFIALPPLQRSALILKDVLGHSLAETATTMATSVSAVKAALVRARSNLEQNPTAPDAAPSTREASAEDRQHLRRYAALFNDRDWDGLRALMTEESRLDVLTRTRRRGAPAAEYYARYEEIAPLEQLRAEVGSVDGRPVIALFRLGATTVPAYFVLIEWDGEKVALIRDFRYVPYITDGARYTPAPSW